MNLRPRQKRRLAAEQAIYRRFANFRDCTIACQKYVIRRGIEDVTFNDRAVKHYVGCYTNFSTKRLKVLADVLGVINALEIDEVFVAPDRRGVGLPWVGDNGNMVKDIDLTILD